MRLEDILKKKGDRERKLTEALERIVSELKALGALRIILFGSLARGEIDTSSDLDLFVLMPSTRQSAEWMDLIYQKVRRGVAADILVYNEEDFVKMLPESAFLQEILASGKVLYEKKSP